MCQRCGSEVISTGRGRPRKYCTSCAPPDARRRYERKTEAVATGRCARCEHQFVAQSPLHQFCSQRCREAAKAERLKFPCAECGAPIFRSSSNRPIGLSTCRACKRKCGTRSQYDRGCRCLDCRRAKSEALAKYLPANYTNHWIAPEQRLAIYERDHWICQLCSLPVDLTVHHLHRDAPTLDHVEPRSLALIPDDRPSNLRTAHRGCNSARGNRESA